MSEIVSEVREVQARYSSVPVSLTLSDAPDSAVRFYAYLEWRAGRKHHAWPGYRSASADLGYSQTTIANAVRWLESHHYLEIKRENGRVNHYFLASPDFGLPRQIMEHTAPDNEAPTAPDNGHEHTKVFNTLKEHLTQPKKPAEVLLGWKECISEFSAGFQRLTGEKPVMDAADFVLLRKRLKPFQKGEEEEWRKALVVIRLATSGKDKPFAENPPALRTILSTYHFNRLMGRLAKEAMQDA